MQELVAGGQSGVLHKWLWHSNIDKNGLEGTAWVVLRKALAVNYFCGTAKNGYVPCCSVYGFVETAARMFARVGAIRYFCNLIQIFRYAT